MSRSQSGLLMVLLFPWPLSPLHSPPPPHPPSPSPLQRPHHSCINIQPTYGNSAPRQPPIVIRALHGDRPLISPICGFPSSIPCGPQLGPSWAKLGPKWAPGGPDWGPFGNAAWVYDGGVIGWAVTRGLCSAQRVFSILIVGLRLRERGGGGTICTYRDLGLLHSLHN